MRWFRFFKVHSGGSIAYKESRVEAGESVGGCCIIREKRDGGERWWWCGPGISGGNGEKSDCNYTLKVEATKICSWNRRRV